TESSEPVELAGEIARRKGRVVVVGAVGMDLPRRPYYERELSLTVACSYGPGRYDSAYEEGGLDYPFPYVRWTEQRNMEAVLDRLAGARLQVAPLISHRIPLAEAERAYRLLEPKPPEGSLGIVLTYPGAESITLTGRPARTRMPPAQIEGPVGIAAV